MMVHPLSRRRALVEGGTALAALALFERSLFAWGREGEQTVPFLDQPTSPPPTLPDLNLLDWQSLGSWITPNRSFFRIGHYGIPKLDPQTWKLEITGLVASPRAYRLEDIRALPRKELVFTLECSGNSGFGWFQGGIGNARWGGTPLASVLEKAGVGKGAVEVVFHGADAGDQTIPYIDGLGNRAGEFKPRMRFARSMSLDEAMDRANLLCYEMNGEPLPAANGFPLRLIAPRWYGVANVKWLTRIEVLDRRFLGPFMAERYVTVRETTGADGEAWWTRLTVGKSRLKSLAAKVTVKDGLYRVYGAAWGVPVARVEARIDDGPWQRTTIGEGEKHEFAWKFWHLEWKNPSPGEHRIASRAIDIEGNLQPAPTDAALADKRTYWENNGQITRRIRI